MSVHNNLLAFSVGIFCIFYCYDAVHCKLVDSLDFGDDCYYYYSNNFIAAATALLQAAQTFPNTPHRLMA